MASDFRKKVVKEAEKKHPSIFRIEYSSKNTPIETPVTQLSLNDLSIIVGERKNQLRDAGLLEETNPIKIRAINDNTLHEKKANLE